MPLTRRKFLENASFLASLAGSAGLTGPLFSNLPGSLGAKDSSSPNEHTRESREAITKGLAWLDRAKMVRGGYRVDIGQAEDIGCTAMVGMAMLADGSTPTKGPNRRKLQEIVSYLIKKIEVMPKSNITSKNNTQLQSKMLGARVMGSDAGHRDGLDEPSIGALCRARRCWLA